MTNNWKTKKLQLKNFKFFIVEKQIKLNFVTGAEAWDIRLRGFFTNQTCMGRPENRQFVLFSAVGYNAKDFLMLQGSVLKIFNAVADDAKKS